MYKRQEVEAAVQSLKKGKSAGVDNSPAELVQAGGEDVITALTICNLYALALNETLEAGGSVRDGVTITRRMWNRTFQGTYSIHHHPAHVELHVHC